MKKPNSKLLMFSAVLILLIISGFVFNYITTKEEIKKYQEEKQALEKNFNELKKEYINVVNINNRGFKS